MMRTNSSIKGPRLNEIIFRSILVQESADGADIGSFKP